MKLELKHLSSFFVQKKTQKMTLYVQLNRVYLTRFLCTVNGASISKISLSIKDLLQIHQRSNKDTLKIH